MSLNNGSYSPGVNSIPELDADDYYADLSLALESGIESAAPVDGLRVVIVDAFAEPVSERTDEVTLTLKIKQRVQHGERWRWSENEAAQKVVSSLVLKMAFAGDVLLDREVRDQSPAVVSQPALEVLSSLSPSAALGEGT